MPRTSAAQLRWRHARLLQLRCPAALTARTPHAMLAVCDPDRCERCRLRAPVAASSDRRDAQHVCCPAVPVLVADAQQRCSAVLAAARGAERAARPLTLRALPAASTGCCEH
jgi:hypothetical protein